MKLPSANLSSGLLVPHPTRAVNQSGLSAVKVSMVCYKHYFRVLTNYQFEYSNCTKVYTKKNAVNSRYRGHPVDGVQ